MRHVSDLSQKFKILELSLKNNIIMNDEKNAIFESGDE